MACYYTVFYDVKMHPKRGDAMPYVFVWDARAVFFPCAAPPPPPFFFLFFAPPYSAYPPACRCRRLILITFHDTERYWLLDAAAYYLDNVER